MKDLLDISKAIKKLKNENEICIFLSELFTGSELADLSKRWRILNLLNNGYTQREIATELKVSLCKVTRGAKILKNKNAVVTKYLRKDK